MQTDLGEFYGVIENYNNRTLFISSNPAYVNQRLESVYLMGQRRLTKFGYGTYTSPSTLYLRHGDNAPIAVAARLRKPIMRLPIQMNQGIARYMFQHGDVFLHSLEQFPVKIRLYSVDRARPRMSCLDTFQEYKRWLGFLRKGVYWQPRSTR
jgi:hypothetical protein